ncbi:hypothetical protein [Apilactobacillus quenuiae]|uniref:hypothetical protein n=1 Tax=Apilactobacillus quenuiae TaxID=2008377 RepID=UPI000D01764B|nr:hypothetical protein [Apilactobacillus quenuiae]
MKEQILFKHITKKYLFISSLVVLLLFLWDLFITGITRTDMDLFSLLHEVFISIPLWTVFNLIIILLFVFNYKNFKLAIQNSISRKNFFKLKIKLILFFSVISDLFNLLENLIDKFIFHISMDELYSKQYDNYFNINFYNTISIFLMTFFVIFFFILVFNTWGSFLSLFSNLWKFIIHIFMISMFISFCFLLSNPSYYDIFAKIMISINANFVLDLVSGFIAGFNNQPLIQNNYSGVAMYNPNFTLVCLIIMFSIFLIANYKITKLQQLNR